MFHYDYTQSIVSSLEAKDKGNPVGLLKKFFLIADSQSENCKTRISEAKIEHHPELGYVLYLAHEDEDLKFLRVHFTLGELAKECPTFLGELLIDLYQRYNLSVASTDIQTRDHPYNEDVGARWVIFNLEVTGGV